MVPSFLLLKYLPKLGIFVPEDEDAEPAPKGESKEVGSDVVPDAVLRCEGATAVTEGVAMREVGSPCRAQVRTAADAAEGTGGILTSSRRLEGAW